MISLITSGEYALFALIVIALVISLTFHEFGHAAMAKAYGDDTAQRAGRLTLNPIPHIDPFGMLMVVLLGFGFAKPVPTDPRNFTSRWASFWVAAAGPLMNLLIAFVVINIFALGQLNDSEWASNTGVSTFVAFLVTINIILMLFNLIPLGPLDGHYMAPYFLPRHLRRPYLEFNFKYGTKIFLVLIVLSILGVPIFSTLFSATQTLIPWLIVVG